MLFDSAKSAPASRDWETRTFALIKVYVHIHFIVIKKIFVQRLSGWRAPLTDIEIFKYDLMNLACFNIFLNSRFLVLLNVTAHSIVRKVQNRSTMALKHTSGRRFRPILAINTTTTHIR